MNKLIIELLKLCDNEFRDQYILDNKTDTYKCKFCHTTFEEGHDVENYGCPVGEYNELSDSIKLLLFTDVVNCQLP